LNKVDKLFLLVERVGKYHEALQIESFDFQDFSFFRKPQAGTVTFITKQIANLMDSNRI
jgi:hypothetical protein